MRKGRISVSYCLLPIQLLPNRQIGILIIGLSGRRGRCPHRPFQQVRDRADVGIGPYGRSPTNPNLNDTVPFNIPFPTLSFLIR